MILNVLSFLIGSGRNARKSLTASSLFLLLCKEVLVSFLHRKYNLTPDMRPPYIAVNTEIQARGSEHDLFTLHGAQTGAVEGTELAQQKAMGPDPCHSLGPVRTILHNIY